MAAAAKEKEFEPGVAPPAPDDAKAEVLPVNPAELVDLEQRLIAYVDDKLAGALEKLEQQIGDGMKGLAEQLADAAATRTIEVVGPGLLAEDVAWLVREAQHLGINVHNLWNHLTRALGNVPRIAERPEGHAQIAPSLQAEQAAREAEAAATLLPESGHDPGVPEGVQS
jgi:hypothetical protein